MKESTKKILSALMVAVILLSAAPLTKCVGFEIFGSKAAETSDPSTEIPSTTKLNEIKNAMDKNYEYSMKDGVATLLRYYEVADTVVTIPSKIGGYPLKTIGADAFRDCKNITSVIIPSGVETIENRAFYACTKLANVILPNSVNTIGYGAFASCPALTSITIPDSVSAIGSKAFAYCSALKSVSVPDSLTTLGDYAFTDTAHYNDKSNYKNGVLYLGKFLLNAINSELPAEYTVKDGTKAILAESFEYCDRLTKIIIPDSVTTIGGRAFYNCSALKELSLPVSVQYTVYHGEDFDDDYSAFDYCNNIEKITLTEGTGMMPDFSLCPWTESLNSIKEVIIEDGVKYIGTYAFANCVNLESITLPDSIEKIGINAFLNSGITNEANWENGVLYVGNHLLQAKTNAYLGDYAVKPGTKSIAEQAFYNCRGFVSITIPDSVINVGNSAFSGCANLTSATIGNSVESIGDSAFSGCANLTSIVIPDSVTNVGYRAFYNCSSLQELTVPVSVQYTLYNSNYYYDDNDYSPIFGCTNIQKIILTKGTGVMPDYNGCFWINSDNSNVSIKEVVVEEGVKNIGDYTFCDCLNLTSIIIPDSVINIGDKAFSGCSSLASITIPDGVTNIGNSAFASCSSLTSITIPDSVTNIGNSAFASCSNLASITIPDSVTSIGNSTFYCCSSLTSITIPDSVTNIGSYAFIYCSNLSEITIGKGVKRIGQSAFGDCYRLKNAYYTGTTKELNNITIERESNNYYLLCLTIHCSDGDAMMYESTTNSPTTTHPTTITPTITKKTYTSTYRYDVTNTTSKLSTTFKPIEHTTTKPATTCPTATAPNNPTESGKITIAKPSVTVVNYGEKVVLHAVAQLPENAKIIWTVNNNNFTYEATDDGYVCVITPVATGDTAFTVCIVNEDGAVIAAHTQTISAKAGIVDKILAFFKRLFGIIMFMPQAKI